MNRANPQLLKELMNAIPHIILKKRTLKALKFTSDIVDVVHQATKSNPLFEAIDLLTMDGALFKNQISRISGFRFLKYLDEYASSVPFSIRELEVRLSALEESVYDKVATKGYVFIEDITEFINDDPDVENIVMDIYEKCRKFPLDQCGSLSTKLMNFYNFPLIKLEPSDLLRIFGRVSLAPRSVMVPKFDTNEDYVQRMEREAAQKRFSQELIILATIGQKPRTDPKCVVVSFDILGKNHVKRRYYPISIRVDSFDKWIDIQGKPNHPIPFPIESNSKTISLKLKEHKKEYEVTLGLLTSGSKILQSKKLVITFSVDIAPKSSLFSLLDLDDLSSNMLIATFQAEINFLPLLKLYWVMSATDPINAWTALARQSLPFLCSETLPIFVNIIQALRELLRRCPITEEEAVAINANIDLIKTQTLPILSFSNLGCTIIIIGSIDDAISDTIDTEMQQFRDAPTNNFKGEALKELMDRLVKAIKSQRSSEGVPTFMLKRLAEATSFIDEDVLSVLDSDTDPEIINSMCDSWKDLRSILTDISESSILKIREWLQSRSAQIVSAIKNINRMEDFVPVNGRGPSFTVYDVSRTIGSIRAMGNRFPDVFEEDFEELINLGLKVYCTHETRVMARVIAQQQKRRRDPVLRSNWKQFGVAFSNCRELLLLWPQSTQFFSVNSIVNSFITAFVTLFRFSIVSCMFRKPKFYPACINVPRVYLVKHRQDIPKNLFASLQADMNSMATVFSSVMEGATNRKLLRALVTSLDRAVISSLINNLPMRKPDLLDSISILVTSVTALFEPDEKIMEHLKDFDVGKNIPGVISLSKHTGDSPETLLRIAKESDSDAERRSAYILLHTVKRTQDLNQVLKLMKKDFMDHPQIKKQMSFSSIVFAGTSSAPSAEQIVK